MGVTDLPEQGVRRFDEYQEKRWWVAYPLAVVRKYADDRGSTFAGVVTFQMFLGMLPLLVVVLTVFGWMLEGSDRLRQAVLESTLRQFPVLGTRLQENVSALAAEGVWVVVAVLGLLWTAAGIYHSMQLALNQAWNVEGIYRQGFVSRHLRAILLFVLVIAAAIGTAFLRGAQVFGHAPPLLLQLGSALVGLLIASLLLLAVFRIAVSPRVHVLRLVPAAIFAGCVWELLQRVGSYLVTQQLTDAEDLYGTIGFVVVLLLWINLLARSAIFANEFAVVGWYELWPRRLTQPPLTEADREVLARLARNERRRPEMRVDVTFEESSEDRGDGTGDGESAAGEPGDQARDTDDADLRQRR